MHDNMADINLDSTHRDPTYYFNDTTVTFLVEGTLFKVHKFFFLKYSEGFSDMFACPPQADGRIEGESDECPIRLDGVTGSEFTCLLDYFYLRSIPKNLTVQGDRLDQRWVDLLSVSTRFTANEARSFAITHITRIFRAYKVNPVHRATIANQFQVKEWLKPAYLEICRREDPLSLEEATELGLAEGWKLMQAWNVCRRVKAPRPVQTPRAPGLGWGMSEVNSKSRPVGWGPYLEAETVYGWNTQGKGDPEKSDPGDFPTDTAILGAFKKCSIDVGS